MTKFRGKDILINPVLRRMGIFSSRQAAEILHWETATLNPILFRLVNAGHLIRIKRGLYCFQAFGVKTQKGYPQNSFLIAKALTGGKPYFFSHYSAMQIHAMTSQTIQTLFISIPVQMQAPGQLRIRVKFITVPKRKFWGLQEKWVTNEEKAWVSDRERTILDALARPDLCGGMMEIARALMLARKELNIPRLLKGLKRIQSYACAKRLGFLLENLKLASPKEIEDIGRFIRKSAAYSLLDPAMQDTGRYLRRWRLRLNISPDELTRNLIT